MKDPYVYNRRFNASLTPEFIKAIVQAVKEVEKNASKNKRDKKVL